MLAAPLTVNSAGKQEEKAERERLARERKVQAKAKVKGKVRILSCHCDPASAESAADGGAHLCYVVILCLSYR